MAASLIPFYVGSLFNMIAFVMYCVAVSNTKWSVFSYGQNEVDLSVTQICVSVSIFGTTTSDCESVYSSDFCDNNNYETQGSFDTVCGGMRAAGAMSGLAIAAAVFSAIILFIARMRARRGGNARRLLVSASVFVVGHVILAIMAIGIWVGEVANASGLDSVSYSRSYGDGFKMMIAGMVFGILCLVPLMKHICDTPAAVGYAVLTTNATTAANYGTTGQRSVPATGAVPPSYQQQQQQQQAPQYAPQPYPYGQQQYQQPQQYQPQPQQYQQQPQQYQQQPQYPGVAVAPQPAPYQQQYMQQQPSPYAPAPVSAPAPYSAVAPTAAAAAAAAPAAAAAAAAGYPSQAPPAYDAAPSAPEKPSQ